jgi:hypothetical protein
MELHIVFFRWKYRRNEANNLFLPFLSVNPSVIIFFYYQRTKNYRRKSHRLSISVGDFVGKLITNGMIVQILTENSVDKFKDCGSVLLLSKLLLRNIT